MIEFNRSVRYHNMCEGVEQITISADQVLELQRLSTEPYHLKCCEAALLGNISAIQECQRLILEDKILAELILAERHLEKLTEPLLPFELTDVEGRVLVRFVATTNENAIKYVETNHSPLMEIFIGIRLNQVIKVWE